MRVGTSLLLSLALVWASSAASAGDAHFVSVTYRPNQQATVVCPAGFLCTVRLESGERVRDGLNSAVPQWDPCASGSDPNKSCSLISQGDVPFLVFRPISAGLTANVVVTSDRRTYFILLRSASGDSPTYLSFRYPSAAPQHRVAAHPAPLTVAEQLVLACSWQATNTPGESYNADSRPAELRPVHVCHDASHTWLQLPALATVPNDLPVLHELTADGGERLANYSVFAVERIVRVDGVGAGYVLRSGGRETMHVHRVAAPGTISRAAPAPQASPDTVLQALLGGNDGGR